MEYSTISILSIVFAIAATVLALIFITPENKRERLNAFGKHLHDLLNFKSLLIEKILKFFYVLSTAYVLFTGFFMLFMVQKVPTGWYETESRWVGYLGLIVLLLGPIVVRIAYEFLLMAILAVKNIIEINKKMDACTKGATAETIQEPEAPKVPQFCALCGRPLNAHGECDHCHK